MFVVLLSANGEKTVQCAKALVFSIRFVWLHVIPVLRVRGSQAKFIVMKSTVLPEKESLRATPVCLYPVYAE